jgi:hypothetical protein
VWTRAFRVASGKGFFLTKNSIVLDNFKKKSIVMEKCGQELFELLREKFFLVSPVFGVLCLL